MRDFSLQRIQALAEELLGVLLSPILLMFFLPDVARNVIGALGSLQHSSPNLGDWCLYGCLDSAIVAESGAASSAEGCQSVQLLNRYGDTNEKLEKSVLSFCLNHQLVWPSSTDHTSEASQAPLLQTRAHQARNLGRQMMPTSTASRAARPLWPGPGHQDIQLEELSLSTLLASPQDLQEDETGGTGTSAPQHLHPQAAADAEPLIDLDSHQDSANDLPAHRGTTSTTSPVNACKEHVLTHIIGVPPTAINLLNDIQDFHEKETSEDPPSGEKVALLPPDLVKLPPLAPGPTALAVTTAGRIGDEPDPCPDSSPHHPRITQHLQIRFPHVYIGSKPQDCIAKEWSNTCGPWFYWLEVGIATNVAACTAPRESAAMQALRAFKARRLAP